MPADVIRRVYSMAKSNKSKLIINDRNNQPHVDDLHKLNDITESNTNSRYEIKQENDTVTDNDPVLLNNNPDTSIAGVDNKQNQDTNTQQRKDHRSVQINIPAPQPEPEPKTTGYPTNDTNDEPENEPEVHLMNLTPKHILETTSNLLYESWTPSSVPTLNNSKNHLSMILT